MHNDDPLQYPDPMDDPSITGGFGDVVLYTGFAASILLLGAIAVPNMVKGASRSMRLKWQERQVEIQKSLPSQPEAGHDPRA
jgi:hypothetical protein